VHLSDITVTNISKSLTYKMVAKIDWHRYGTKLRHCHPMYADRLIISCCPSLLTAPRALTNDKAPAYNTSPPPLQRLGFESSPGRIKMRDLNRRTMICDVIACTGCSTPSHFHFRYIAATILHARDFSGCRWRHPLAPPLLSLQHFINPTVNQLYVLRIFLPQW